MVKTFNIILYIELSHVIIVYVTLKLKTVKPVTTVVKRMTLHISANIAPKVSEFWSFWFKWLEHLSDIAIKNSPILEECIIFGFPLNSAAVQVLKFCLFYTKYYIYIQSMFHNNKLDLYACLTHLKFALEV